MELQSHCSTLVGFCANLVHDFIVLGELFLLLAVALFGAIVLGIFRCLLVRSVLFRLQYTFNWFPCSLYPVSGDALQDLATDDFLPFFIYLVHRSVSNSQSMCWFEWDEVGRKHPNCSSSYS